MAGHRTAYNGFPSTRGPTDWSALIASSSPSDLTTLLSTGPNSGESSDPFAPRPPSANASPTIGKKGPQVAKVMSMGFPGVGTAAERIARGEIREVDLPPPCRACLLTVSGEVSSERAGIRLDPRRRIFTGRSQEAEGKAKSLLQSVTYGTPSSIHMLSARFRAEQPLLRPKLLCTRSMRKV